MPYPVQYTTGDSHGKICELGDDHGLTLIILKMTRPKHVCRSDKHRRSRTVARGKLRNALHGIAFGKRTRRYFNI
jgi:hypothetical protein